MEKSIREDLGSGVAGNVRPVGDEAGLVVRPSTRRVASAQGEGADASRPAQGDPSRDGSLCEPAQDEGGSKADGRTRRRKFGEEVWALAAPEYFGGATARQISAKYGMSLQTVYARFAGRGKRALAREKKTSAAPGQKAMRALSEDEALRVGRIVLAEALEGAAAHLRAAPERVEARRTQDGRIETRVYHSEETWAAVRRDYEEGGHTVPRIAERYGIKVATIKRRARIGKWSKIRKCEALPLTPPVDEAQVKEEGKSAWGAIAHAAQLAPERTASGGRWKTWLFQGGRGAGKTRAGAEWLAGLAERTPYGRFALVGPTEHDVREVMIHGPSGLMNLPGRERCYYEASRRRVVWKHNGAVAYAFSAEEPERLRGPQFMAAWADEFAIWPKPDHTLAMLRMGLRLGEDPRLVVTTTPKPIGALRKLHREKSCVVTLAPTEANAANLHEEFLAGLTEIYGGTRLAQQELMGELLSGEGALWSEAMLARARALWGQRPAAADFEKFERVVVGVDPPAGSGGACGIVAAARIGRTGAVLEDASVVGASPMGWAVRVAETVKRWQAKRVIAEANQGGEMVRATLAAAGVTCPIELVHASEGKRARAEPVAALYEQNRVAHAGAFAALEEEMMALGASDAGETRLDRADALVWALTAILVMKQPCKPAIIVL